MGTIGWSGTGAAAQAHVPVGTNRGKQTAYRFWHKLPLANLDNLSVRGNHFQPQFQIMFCVCVFLVLQYGRVQLMAHKVWLY